MEVQFGPNAHDEPNLLYKLQRKIKVFETSDLLPNRGYNLVASSSKYGAVFIGTPDGKLAVYHLKELLDKECEPNPLPVQLQEKPTHIAVNSDEELLAVTGGSLFVLFVIVELLNQNVTPSKTVQFDIGPSTFVSDVKWNPCVPDTIAYAFYDGSIVICQSEKGQVKKLQSNARCICWSPKGKQLVAGNSDGTICQYKPDLSLMKSFPAPNLFQNAPVEVMAIHWISTFQFAVVYRNASDNSKPAVAIVNTPKGGQPSCLNYEDVCYSMGTSRPWYYYLQGLAQWNVILCSSSNSMEIATLGTIDGASWLQWCQSDEARPELPLTDKKQENYPIGITLDTAAVHQLPWGENEKLPFMPTLHVLSQTGLLTVFNVINLNKEAPQICSQVTVVSNIPFPVQKQPISQPDAPQPKPAEPEPSPFGQSAPSFGIAPSIQAQLPQAPVVQPMKPQEIQVPSAPIQVQPKLQQKPTQEINAQKVAQEINAQRATQELNAQRATQEMNGQRATQELNAALKAEQELANKLKVELEFQEMMVKEVNDFQVELYEFVVETRKAQLQFYRDLHAIDTSTDLQNLDAATLKKDCSLEELREAIRALKLDLVRTCAVVAEASTHSNAKELDQWTQADPLTTKRVASVKKLAYYVKSQLEQAQSALNYKWKQLDDLDLKASKPGPRMTRPVLDQVYQPLVRQQEILARQAAELRLLRSTLDSHGPLHSATSVLRTTPGKKDPLSKLTKNILNMSLEPHNPEKKSLFTPQKLDALRDMLSNHKTVKIKPVNVELTHHLTTMRRSYEKFKDAENKQATTRVQVKQERAVIKEEPKIVEPKPAFAPIAVNPTSKTTWRTQEPKKEPVSPQTGSQEVVTAPSTQTSTRDVLKNLLENRQVTVEVKKDDNIMGTFMGQKICSPSFNFSSVIVASPTQSSFTTKPISALSNMFNQFSQAGAEIEPKPQQPEMTNLFKMTPTKPNPPDVLGNSNMITIKRVETLEPKTEKTDKSKENAPVKTENVILSIPKVKEVKRDEPKPLAGSVAQPVAVSSAVTVKTGDLVKPEVNTKQETESKETPKSVAAPVPAATVSSANGTIAVPKPKSIFGSATTATPLQASTSNADSSSIFAAANTSAPKTQSSIFTASTPTVIGSKPSIFGTSTPAATETAAKPETPTSTPKSIFSSAFTATTTAAAVTSKTSESLPSPTSVATTQAVSTASTQATSIFGSPTSTTQPSVFGGPPVSSPSVFGAASTKSTFGATPTAVTTATTTTLTSPATKTPTPVTTTPSVFGSSATPTSVFGSTTTASSVFGSTATSFGTATTTQASIFGTSTASTTFGSTATTSSVFGSTTAPSVFGSAVTTTTSVFGAAAPASVFGSTDNSASSVFGTAVKSAFGTPTTTSAFGTPTTTAAFGTPTTTSAFGTQGSVFAPTSTQASVFGATSTSVFGTASTQASVFGSPTTTQSVFGTTTPSVFGTPTTQSSVFGSPATTQSAFGSPSAFAPNQSVFGSPTSPASVFGAQAQTSVFGTPSTQASVFGTPTQSTQASVFGTPTQTTQASVFGTPTQSSQASVFGTPTQGTTGSVFGTPTTQAFGGQSVFGAATTTQSSMFGGESLFASVNISTTSASSPGSIFGGSTGSGFGSSNTNIFGAKTTFGQPNPATEAIFGGASTGGGFGQTQPNNFWGSNNSSGGFGSSGFGAATTQAGAFSGSFSAPAPAGQAFGSPTSSPGGFGSGFGSKAVFGQPAGFGSPSSGFGAPASFSASKSPGFGAAATFGSPAAATGFGAAPASGFGSPIQSNATFENLATQNTLTFGNLAQQSAPAQPAPNFNTSPSFTGWRG